jgi:hypothetical protein
MKRWAGVVLLPAVLVGCREKGCTDPVGVNYSAEADFGDPCWECDYPSDVVVWWKPDVAATWEAAGIDSVLVRMGGEEVGIFSVQASHAVAPPCGEVGVAVQQFVVGRSCYLASIHLECAVEDAQGNVLWSSFTVLEPMVGRVSCNHLEVTL